MNPKHPLTRANWIWPDEFYHLHNTYAQFRHDFQLSRVPAKAPFFITADQSYRLYVNGRYVGRGPARGYQASWPYDEYDLATVLRRGHNWISIQAYNPAVSNFQYLHQAAAGLLCAAEWGPTLIRSGKEWLMRISPGHRQDTDRLSMQLAFQEHADARLDDQSWIRSAQAPAVPRERPLKLPFGVMPWRTRPVMAWSHWCVMRTYGAMPWHDLEPRGVPNLGQELVPYERTCTAATGRAGEGFADWFNVTDGFRGELARLRWHKAAPGRAAKDGLKITLPATGPDKLVAVALDLGRISVGNLVVEATGAAGGEVLDFFLSEGLNADGLPILARKGVACGSSMSYRLRLGAGRTAYEFHQMIGHRYLTAIARDTRRPLALKLAFRETVYPFQMKGRFETSDALLNDIYRISVRTQRVCSLDAYVDTPWREQAQWWGDARVQSQNTFHLAGDPRLLVRGIRSLSRQEVPNGLTYGHAPTIAHSCILPDFSLIWILSIWDYYWQTGDLSLFVEQWPRIEKVLGYFTGEGRGKNGLLQYDKRYWLFLDWTEFQREGTPTLLNLWYLHTLDKLAELSGLAKMPAEQKRFRAMYREQRRLVETRLWDRGARLFRDGILSDGRPSKVHSIHNQVLGIICGLKPEHHQTMITRRLLPYLRGLQIPGREPPTDSPTLQGRKMPGGQPSPYWVTYVYGVMNERGYGRDVVRHIRHAWAPMVPWGGTFETFHFPIGDGTCSHAWAAHPIYNFVRTLGGVTQTAVAWRRIKFAPVFDLAPGAGAAAKSAKAARAAMSAGDTASDRASAVVPTPLGLIRTSWRRQGRQVEVSLSLPKGITADVRLPGLRPASVTGKKRWEVKVQLGIAASS